MLINANLNTDEIREKYKYAEPFPHVVIDDFLEPGMAAMFETVAAESDLGNEALDKGGIKSFSSGYGGDLKIQINPSSLSEGVRSSFEKFNQQEFILLLEQITGIAGLFGDPFYAGGGIHRTRSGGRLGIHADFRVNKRLKVVRRINVILYLNPVWDESWGGYLELWTRDGKKCAKKVAPIFNRCVIFQTDESSFHGHPHPLATPESVTRNSLALYYYTGSERSYLSESRKTTVYIDGDDTDFELGNRVKYGLINLGLELLPPIISRRIFK